MKITFLGTSHGVPAADRYCSCTMLESGNSVYLIDAGAPVVDCLLREGKHVNELRAAFITHIHGDHTNGLFHLVDLMNWYYKESAADFYIPEQSLIDTVETVVKTVSGFSLNRDRLRMHCVESSLVYEDENIRVEYIPTAHMGERHQTYSILVTEGTNRVLFSGDFSGMLSKKDVPTIIAEDGLDLFLCELAHFGLRELSPYLDTCKAKRVYFNHVFPLEKYNDIESAKAQYSFEIGTPKDGDVLVI